MFFMEKNANTKGMAWEFTALVVGCRHSESGNPGVWSKRWKNLLLSGKMASNVEAPERWYLALLGFAEHFRTSSPPKIRLCVHCLQAVFQFKPPQRIEARTHLQLGSVLYHHTKNSELARSHLEKAVRNAPHRKERGCSWEGDVCRPEAVKTANDGNLHLAVHSERLNLWRSWSRIRYCIVWYVVVAFVRSSVRSFSCAS